MIPIAIEEIIKKIRDLPSLSAVVTELMTSINQEAVNLTALVEKLSRDQALTAKTLRLANSSFYGMQGKVTTIHQAITVLGFNNVRTLVTAAAVTGSFPASTSGGFNFRTFWQHSIATAVCAKALARQLNMNQEYAFTAGLLHDIGKLVLVTRYAPQYQEVMDYRAASDCYIQQAELAIFGVDHAEVGRALTAHWKFSAAMQNAVAGHHQPEEQGVGSIASLVHLANSFAHALDLCGEEDDLVPPISTVIWQGLGLSEDICVKVFREAEMQFDEMCSVLVS